MQWKLYVAGLTVLLLVGEAVQAGPFGLFQGRRNRMNNNSDSGMVVQPVATTPVVAADTAPTAPVATVPANTIYQQPVSNGSSRRGGRLFGRRNGGGTYSEPVTMIQPASTTIVANAPAAERMPAPSVASGTTTASTTSTISYQPVTYSRGLMGRRSYTVWEPVAMIQPVATAPASAESATVMSPTYSTQPTSTSRGRTGLFGRRNRGSDMPMNTAIVTTPGATGTRQAFYGPGAQTALIDIRVPAAAAEIFFNGARTNQTGISRLFVTPALDPQKDNTYEVKAKWIENGEQKERTETVKVPAGGRILVDFTTSPR